ncbi:Stp1/IreP family PP2C-type Ser/Thr phosphatase [Aeribacillus pallidus]
MKTAVFTDKGKVRTHNEDAASAILNRHGQILAVVADGMGGHLAGDVASRMTIEHFEKSWNEAEKMEHPEQAERWINDHIAEVNEELLTYANEHKECKGMGTTFVGAICTESFATIAHIGDSRCYLLNKAGFAQITDDHSLVNELVKSGQISKEDAKEHPRKNILLKALGTEQSVDADIKTVGLEVNDYLLLCSDGLSNKVQEHEMESILSSDQSLEEKAKELIRLANENGGDDNISVITYKHVIGHESDGTC